ncbi:MAG: FliG C-terminal domain-containing protein [Pirellulales bacterium]
MSHKSRNLRKAAVLVSSLDDERAAAILDHMPPAQAAAVRQAVDRLGHVDPAEQHEVIEEFFRLGPLLPDREPSGIELTDPRCAALATTRAICEREFPQHYGHQAELASDALDAASAETLAAFLAREQPQTIAVLVAHLPSQRAADVLAALPGELQVDVARRVVDLEETDPKVLREIERGLESWLTQQAAAERRRVAGLTALGNILEAAPSRTRSHILAGLGQHDRDVPQRQEPIAPPSLTFFDLEQLDAKSLGVVLRQAHGELLLLALAGARPEFVERALALFPPTKAQLVRRALNNLGPMRLSDVEQAQGELAQLAEQLMLRGDIVQSQPRHLSVAV